MAAPEIDDGRLGIWETRRKKESKEKHLCAVIVKDTGNIIKLRIKLLNSDIFSKKMKIAWINYTYFGGEGGRREIFDGQSWRAAGLRRTAVYGSVVC